jgi:hypothetical protein
MRISNVTRLTAVAAIALVALSGCEKRSRGKNSSASAGLIDEGTVATTNVYRFVGAEQSLSDARKAAAEERWGDAIAATDALLAQQPGNAEAKSLNAQARSELPNAQRWSEFEKAVKANDIAVAIRHYRQLPEASVYREKGRPTFEKIGASFVENQIADARAFNRAGRCDDARRVARTTGDWFPDAKGRLDEAAAGCRPAKGAPPAPEPAAEVVKLEEKDKVSPPIAMAPIATAQAVPMAAEAPRQTASDVAKPGPERTLAAALPTAGTARVTAAAPPPAAPEAPAAAPLARNIPIAELEPLRTAGDKDPSLPAGAKMIARRDGVKRITVAVKLCVSDKGVPTSVNFVKSSDYGDANEKILSDIRKWRFRPYKLNGAPTPVCTAVLLHYQIL